MNPDALRCFQRFQIDDVFSREQIAALEELAKLRGRSLEQTIWDLVDQLIMREKHMEN
jgi:hypothetical protein